MLSFPMIILLAIALLSGVLGKYTSKYGPVVSKCPMTPLVRNASKGVGHLENSYLHGRKEKTDKALAAWLKKTNPAFNTTKLPTVALAHSGGGYRAMLCGAGLVKGFDGRDSDVSTSGLLQGMTYQVGLSGGAWLLSGLIGNNYPTISSIVEDHWKEALKDSALMPHNLFGAIGTYYNLHYDFQAKDVAGFDNTLVDLWGKLISYQLLSGDRWASTLSDVTEYSEFRSNDMPFPIITALGVNNPVDKCFPDNVTSPSYEFTPYEFGSWDDGVASFTQTHFLGTVLNNGEAYPPGQCMTNYDNLGYILGSSSNIIAFLCAQYWIDTWKALHEKLQVAFWKLVDRVDGPHLTDEYALFRNPFFQWASAGQVKDEKSLYLVDGGGGGQNVPLHPLLQPARNVDVIIVGDNSAPVENFDGADQEDSYPTGLDMYNTYQQSLVNGLNRMPYIPEPSVFRAQNLTKRPVFFGCWDEKAVTIVWLPNMEYTHNTGMATDVYSVSKGDTDNYIENGVQIATRRGDKRWPECLGCVMMQKMGSQLPEGCRRCRQEYCYEL